MIYKYCPCSEYTFSNLRSGAFYCRHFEDYNDPFEIWWKLESGLPNFEDSDERFRRAVSAWGFPDTLKKDLPCDIELWNEYFGDLAENAPSFVFENTRITCFSQTADNLLMWSHYADGLRGFCIEFDETTLFNEDDDCFLVPVSYTAIPPVVDSLEYAVTEDLYNYALDHGYEEYEGEKFRSELNEIIRKAVASKPIEWKYEEEVRLVINLKTLDSNPIMFPYRLNSIKSIIVGERMPISSIDRLKEILGELNLPITIKKAIRSKDKYLLTIEEITD